ncbi:MAG: hypothetical protein GY797_38765 [Deltaproteobacteria bacterium]|nr:hypothetical protein [Deltaproteobacteria bacterium]
MGQKDKEKIVKYKVGDTFPIICGTLPLYKAHVIGIVHDQEPLIVYKWYGRHKQWWHYAVDTEYFVDMKVDSANRLKEKHK